MLNSPPEISSDDVEQPEVNKDVVEDGNATGKNEDRAVHRGGECVEPDELEDGEIQEVPGGDEDPDVLEDGEILDMPAKDENQDVTDKGENANVPNAEEGNLSDSNDTADNDEPDYFEHKPECFIVGYESPVDFDPLKDRAEKQMDGVQNNGSLAGGQRQASNSEWEEVERQLKDLEGVIGEARHRGTDDLSTYQDAHAKTLQP